jgi:hypothetical protein
MSKQGLAELFAAKKMTLSEGEVEELMSRFDTNGDGQVVWREFLALVRSSTELEMMFKALPLQRLLEGEATQASEGASDKIASEGSKAENNEPDNDETEKFLNCCARGQVHWCLQTGILTCADVC